MVDLYEHDFVAWTRKQAEALRREANRRANAELDYEHLAEEVEDLGKSERDAVRSQVRRILEHFLKLEFSPAESPRNGWKASIVDARAAIADKITETLRRDLREVLPGQYRSAMHKAALDLTGEGELTDRLPESCPYDLDKHILAEGWYPGRE
jgi:hypothetical protein